MRIGLTYIFQQMANFTSRKTAIHAGLRLRIFELKAFHCQG
ncbi:hypothetical protein DSOL_1413 [Desulfosporosinus metallidurans]|uniref:Uncharacterized protein n=1 Tax=Desulfosporosinus metallidurans TaxID=1888891 RepID=A0A1Q8QZ71_9FIRM|nr:hypothetical protein DSOL_1413 [Desulfosporosinus metallidurans]